MQDVRHVIEERREVYLDWLIQICRQPSVAAQNVGMQETAALVEQLTRRVGASTRCIPTKGFPVVFGEILGVSDKTLSFYDHYDVQPPEPLELWDSPPFEPTIPNGRFYARGVADNKGNLIARLAAVDAYLRARGELPVNVKFLFEGEEEIGSPNLAEFAQGHQDLIEADGCIWEAGYSDVDGRREVYLGLKGILYVELTARRANTDLHSMWAAIVPSAAWQLLRALQTIKDDQDRVLIPGFYDKVLEPTPADLQMLANLPFNEQERRKQLGLDAFVNNLTGQPLLEKFVFQPTANICGIESGYTGQGLKTVLPHEASCKIDFRLVPNQDPHELYERLVKHLQNSGFADVDVHLRGTLHPARTPTEHPFAQLVIESVQEVYDHEPVVYPLTPGSGPMYDLCQRYGIPAVSIGVGNEDSRIHAPNENIRLEDFYQGIEHIVYILEHFGSSN